MTAWLAILLLIPATSANDALRIVRDESTVTILDGDRPVLRYRYAEVPKKPYVDQLFSPGGVQILRDAPHDHLHHHGMMFALAIDDVNFWEESATNSGRQIGKDIQLEPDVKGFSNRNGLTLQLEWAGPNSDQPLLVEERTIEVVSEADSDATLVEWRCRLQPPPGRDAVVLKGNPYHGLGMRFLSSMDVGGRFFNADDKLGELLERDLRLTPVRWCAYTAAADGKPVTVAIFDHPDNPRPVAKMFTMTDPFAYLSATRNLWKEPITVQAGRPLELRYGVALWDGVRDKDAVEKLHKRWIALH